jgi:hypothetical protein
MAAAAIPQRAQVPGWVKRPVFGWCMGDGRRATPLGFALCKKKLLGGRGGRGVQIQQGAQSVCHVQQKALS